MSRRRRRREPRPSALLAGLLLAALSLAGCAEVEERLVLQRDGDGAYTLTLRWNSDLLQRVRETVGERAVAAMEGRAFPLRQEDWRESLRGLHGLKLVSLEERVEAGGWRVLALEVAFASLEDLARWELFGRRTLRVSGSDDPRRGRLAMDPFTRLPLLDPMLDVAAVRREPPPAGEAHDPGPLQRLGLEPTAVELVERMLAPHLARLKLSSTVAPAGRVFSAGERAAEIQEREARFSWTWDDLLRGVPRGVELEWTPGEFDRVPQVEHAGDEPLPQAPAQTPVDPAAGASKGG